MNTLPRLIITPGEPSGIGPDVVLEVLRQSWSAEVVVAADRDLLQQRAALLDIPCTFEDFDPQMPPKPHQAGRVPVWQHDLSQPAEAGQLNTVNAPYVLNTLTTACDTCLDKRFDAIVTAPVHKGIINDAGVNFSGHTEFFAERCGNVHPVMMLATGRLRVALATTHLPLSEVSAAITTQRLQRVIRILHHDLENHFGLQNPKILVAGLNPHAGENGHLGREEIEIIEPTLDTLRAEGINLIGPLPADTLFTPRYLDHADAVLAMYHDQGLPVLKHVGFGRAVNITLGLPIIRTSVDHGTACDLAGTGKADSGSMLEAMNQALQMVQAS